MISLNDFLCFRYEKLDEKDVDVSIEDSDVTQTSNQKSESAGLSLDTDDVISNSQSNVKDSQEVDEEYEIEEYED